MCNENILQETVALVPRISSNNGTEVISLIIHNLVKFKPLALMSGTEEENLQFLENRIISQFDFIIGFLENTIANCKEIHDALYVVIRKELKDFVFFLDQSKTSSKEGKTIDVDFQLEVTEHHAILICDLLVNGVLKYSKEFQACVF